VILAGVVAFSLRRLPRLRRVGSLRSAHRVWVLSVLIAVLASGRRQP
jgi:hypothetical protein